MVEAGERLLSFLYFGEEEPAVDMTVGMRSFLMDTAQWHFVVVIATILICVITSVILLENYFKSLINYKTISSFSKEKAVIPQTIGHFADCQDRYDQADVLSCSILLSRRKNDVQSGECSEKSGHERDEPKRLYGATKIGDYVTSLKTNGSDVQSVGNNYFSPVVSCGEDRITCIPDVKRCDPVANTGACNDLSADGENIISLQLSLTISTTPESRRSSVSLKTNRSFDMAPLSADEATFALLQGDFRSSGHASGRIQPSHSINTSKRFAIKPLMRCRFIENGKQRKRKSPLSFVAGSQVSLRPGGDSGVDTAVPHALISHLGLTSGSLISICAKKVGSTTGACGSHDKLENKSSKNRQHQVTCKTHQRSVPSIHDEAESDNEMYDCGATHHHVQQNSRFIDFRLSNTYRNKNIVRPSSNKRNVETEAVHISQIKDDKTNVKESITNHFSIPAATDQNEKQSRRTNISHGPSRLVCKNVTEDCIHPQWAATKKPKNVSRLYDRTENAGYRPVLKAAKDRARVAGYKAMTGNYSTNMNPTDNDSPRPSPHYFTRTQHGAPCSWGQSPRYDHYWSSARLAEHPYVEEAGSEAVGDTRNTLTEVNSLNTAFWNVSPVLNKSLNLSSSTVAYTPEDDPSTLRAESGAGVVRESPFYTMVNGHRNTSPCAEKVFYFHYDSDNESCDVDLRASTDNISRQENAVSSRPSFKHNIFYKMKPKSLLNLTPRHTVKAPNLRTNFKLRSITEPANMFPASSDNYKSRETYHDSVEMHTKKSRIPLLKKIADCKKSQIACNSKPPLRTLNRVGKTDTYPQLKKHVQRPRECQDVKENHCSIFRSSCMASGEKIAREKANTLHVCPSFQASSQKWVNCKKRAKSLAVTTSASTLQGLNDISPAMSDSSIIKKQFWEVPTRGYLQNNKENSELLHHAHTKKDPWVELPLETSKSGAPNIKQVHSALKVGANHGQGDLPPTSCNDGPLASLKKNAKSAILGGLQLATSYITALALPTSWKRKTAPRRGHNHRVRVGMEMLVGNQDRVGRENGAAPAWSKDLNMRYRSSVQSSKPSSIEHTYNGALQSFLKSTVSSALSLLSSTLNTHGSIHSDVTAIDYFPITSIAYKDYYSMSDKTSYSPSPAVKSEGRKPLIKKTPESEKSYTEDATNEDTTVVHPFAAQEPKSSLQRLNVTSCNAVMKLKELNGPGGKKNADNRSVCVVRSRDQHSTLKSSHRLPPKAAPSCDKFSQSAKHSNLQSNKLSILASVKEALISRKMLANKRPVDREPSMRQIVSDPDSDDTVKIFTRVSQQVRQAHEAFKNVPITSVDNVLSKICSSENEWNRSSPEKSKSDRSKQCQPITKLKKKKSPAQPNSRQITKSPTLIYMKPRKAGFENSVNSRRNASQSGLQTIPELHRKVLSSPVKEEASEKKKSTGREVSSKKSRLGLTPVRHQLGDVDILREKYLKEMQSKAMYQKLPLDISPTGYRKSIIDHYQFEMMSLNRSARRQATAKKHANKRHGASQCALIKDKGACSATKASTVHSVPESEVRAQMDSVREDGHSTTVVNIYGLQKDVPDTGAASRRVHTAAKGQLNSGDSQMIPVSLPVREQMVRTFSFDPSSVSDSCPNHSTRDGKGMGEASSWLESKYHPIGEMNKSVIDSIEIPPRISRISEAAERLNSIKEIPTSYEPLFRTPLNEKHEGGEKRGDRKLQMPHEGRQLMKNTEPKKSKNDKSKDCIQFERGELKAPAVCKISKDNLKHFPGDSYRICSNNMPTRKTSQALEGSAYDMSKRACDEVCKQSNCAEVNSRPGLRTKSSSMKISGPHHGGRSADRLTNHGTRKARPKSPASSSDAKGVSCKIIHPASNSQRPWRLSDEKLFADHREKLTYRRMSRNPPQPDRQRKFRDQRDGRDCPNSQQLAPSGGTRRDPLRKSLEGQESFSALEKNNSATWRRMISGKSHSNGLPGTKRCCCRWKPATSRELNCEYIEYDVISDGRGKISPCPNDESHDWVLKSDVKEAPTSAVVQSSGMPETKTAEVFTVVSMPDSRNSTSVERTSAENQLDHSACSRISFDWYKPLATSQSRRVAESNGGGGERACRHHCDSGEKSPPLNVKSTSARNPQTTLSKAEKSENNGFRSMYGYHYANGHTRRFGGTTSRDAPTGQSFRAHLLGPAHCTMIRAESSRNKPCPDSTPHSNRDIQNDTEFLPEDQNHGEDSISVDAQTHASQHVLYHDRLEAYNLTNQALHNKWLLQYNDGRLYKSHVTCSDFTHNTTPQGPPHGNA